MENPGVVELIAEVESFAALCPEWDPLLQQSQTNELALTWTWIWNWWQVYGTDRQPFILTVRDRGQLIGLAPLLSRSLFVSPMGPYRRLEFLGSGEAEEDEVGLGYLNLLAVVGREQEVAREVGQALRTRFVHEWDEIVLTRIRPDRVLSRHLEESLRASPFHVTTKVCGTCPFVTLPSTWEEYLASLSRRGRYQVRRSLQALEAQPAWEFRQLAQLEELAEMKAQLVRLRQERWQAKGEPGVFASSRFCQFHDRVMPALWAKGCLELASLSLDGEVVAALYGLAYNRRFHAYLLGMRPQPDPHLRPGFLLHVLCLREAIQRRFQEYDFLLGEARYKETLAQEKRVLQEIRVCQHTLKEQWARSLRVAERLRRRVSGRPETRKDVSSE